MDPQEQAALTGAGSGAMAGAAFGPYGALIGGLAGGAVGYFGTPKRPKYQVNPEYDQNKALAAMTAFGTSGAVRRASDQTEQDASNSAFDAQRYTSSTGSLLNTLRSIYGNKIQAQRNLAGMDAQVQQQGRQELAGANVASAEENDKAWNYNVNMPYQLQIDANQQFQKSLQENSWKYMDYLNSKKLLEKGYGAGYNPGNGGNDVVRDDGS